MGPSQELTYGSTHTRIESNKISRYIDRWTYLHSLVAWGPGGMTVETDRPSCPIVEKFEKRDEDDD